MNAGAQLIAAIGALLSGAGAVLTAAGAIYYERRRSRQECERRIEAFREGLKHRK